MSPTSMFRLCSVYIECIILQVKYVIPVDEGAAVYKFEAHLDGRTIAAQCMEKKKVGQFECVLGYIDYRVKKNCISD